MGFIVRRKDAVTVLKDLDVRNPRSQTTKQGANNLPEQIGRSVLWDQYAIALSILLKTVRNRIAPEETVDATGEQIQKNVF